ncbi:hypothetical protein GWO43_22590 [candidate division KSB1 bacterium]|nr:hypothetical protein [candidate division KSB1 bacterium]NIR72731.1 hypothetical protein [candidate division KSB1 bacterium]NIS26819.1 hypothetical protein [candidate division KSB1 bacterium]NIT73613.1 hypothetical protein [candidate division KSB1 bacterium]NIU27486.1 hypothetical protein [candidate division KSB1 bacterium]
MAVVRDLLALVCASILLVVSQEALAKADTTLVSSDTTNIDVTEEIVLDEIFIEAVIEKPNVAILPARVETDYGDVEFIDRSFKHELKEGPDRLLFMDAEFELAKKLEKLKEILDREKRSK